VLSGIIEAPLLHVHIPHDLLRHRVSVVVRERPDGVFLSLDKAPLKVTFPGKFGVFFGLDVRRLHILWLWTRTGTRAGTAITRCSSACATLCL
jgi:hypothetical protein